MKWLIAFIISFSHLSFALEARFTNKDQVKPHLVEIIKKINENTQTHFRKTDFLLIENRELSNYNFQYYVQTINGVPVENANIRIWSDLESKQLTQAEIKLEAKSPSDQNKMIKKMQKSHFHAKSLASKILNRHIMNLVTSYVRNTTDSEIKSLKTTDFWRGEDLIRKVLVKGRRGTHTIIISLFQNRIIDSSYEEFSLSDHGGDKDEYITIAAKIFKIYEEVEATHERLPQVLSELKYIKKNIPYTKVDPYAPLKERKYHESMYNSFLALTTDGWNKGYWSTLSLKNKANELEANLKTTRNNFKSGLLLEGKFVSINLHPDVKSQMSGIEFQLNQATKYLPKWIEREDGWELIPSNGLLGKPIFSNEELLTRDAIRDASHDPVTYINNGFDEVQVYWSVTTFMESLINMGMNDPELSTRQFHAFLYDPDIGMRDNAYYTDDTINFTTYSPEAINYARDNSTIWHELGHGIMDRLMGEGSFLNLTDTGGLSEGMADFLAQLVVLDVMKDEDFPGKNYFRIINNIGFNLTNEVHDDGEAYGGAMFDMLNLAQEKFGFNRGLLKMTDLTLETMRLTRYHHALDANEWFNHMLYADEFGSNKRNSGEFKDIILDALKSRNYSFTGEKIANFEIKFNGEELTSSGLASRNKPITLTMKEGESASYDIDLKLISSEVYNFKFPVTVLVDFKKGALQGAIDWQGEEENPFILKLDSINDMANFKLIANGKCDSINQPENSCKDYAYIQIINDGETKPVAKKRFYLKIKN
jgi:hypothetical protein